MISFERFLVVITPRNDNSTMLNIQIIAIGKLKETYWKQAEAEYLKRLSPYAKIGITELQEEAFRSVEERDLIDKTGG